MERWWRRESFSSVHARIKIHWRIWISGHVELEKWVSYAKPLGILGYAIMPQALEEEYEYYTSCFSLLLCLSWSFWQACLYIFQGLEFVLFSFSTFFQSIRLLNKLFLNLWSTAILPLQFIYGVLVPPFCFIVRFLLLLKTTLHCSLCILSHLYIMRIYTWRVLLKNRGLLLDITILKLAWWWIETDNTFGRWSNCHNQSF